MSGTDPRRGTAMILAGVVVGIGLSIVVGVFVGITIAFGPAFGIALGVAAAAAIVWQIVRWSSATDFERGLLLGQILVALIAGACFAMLLNLRVR